MADARPVGSVFLSSLLLSVTAAPSAGGFEPDCSGPDRYPASMAFVKLKNDGFLTNENVDFDHVKSTMTVSQRVGKGLWRQVFRVTFPMKSGQTIEAIVISDADLEECSISDPQVFLVSKAL
jgi:hypothetical protein